MGCLVSFCGTRASCPESSGWRLPTAGGRQSRQLIAWPPTWVPFCLLSSSALQAIHSPILFLFPPPCPCFSRAIFHCPLCFFCSAVPWKHAAPPPLTASCAKCGPVPGSQCGKRKGMERGGFSEPALTAWEFEVWVSDPDVDAKESFVFQLPPGDTSWCL